MKQLVYIIFFVSLFWISANRSEAQSTNILPKSEFTVLHTNDYYQKTIAQDTTKQMAVMNKYIPNIKIDFVYATASNFTHQILYKKNLGLLTISYRKCTAFNYKFIKSKRLRSINL